MRNVADFTAYKQREERIKGIFEAIEISILDHYGRKDSEEKLFDVDEYTDITAGLGVASGVWFAHLFTFVPPEYREAALQEWIKSLKDVINQNLKELTHATT